MQPLSFLVVRKLLSNFHSCSSETWNKASELKHSAAQFDTSAHFPQSLLLCQTEQWICEHFNKVFSAGCPCSFGGLACLFSPGEICFVELSKLPVSWVWLQSYQRAFEIAVSGMTTLQIQSWSCQRVKEKPKRGLIREIGQRKHTKLLAY